MLVPGRAPSRRPAPPPQHEVSPGTSCPSLWGAGLWEEGAGPSEAPPSDAWSDSETPGDNASLAYFNLTCQLTCLNVHKHLLTGSDDTLHQRSLPPPAGCPRTEEPERIMRTTNNTFSIKEPEHIIMRTTPLESLNASS
ncbi:hypothetical protein F7725_024627 [Dissostichus mawsoni]|uniref:Uncharacterized protein n=1 Tax=Dissostichus mawsoni TaxID=36200 RepID=A0A7J5X9D7_DISMA|nr:hypothetical protein F7725_024627 [Dissostichus mawsoni]